MTTLPRVAALALALLASLAAVACIGTRRATLSASELDRAVQTENEEYRIGAGDVLQISVWQQQELTLDRIVVRLDGKISVPLLDDVQAEGLTAAELKDDLTERLAEYITLPQVTVIVREINSKAVYILGEVNRAGLLPYRRGMRVIDALSVAGGFQTFADKARIKVIRSRDGAEPIEFIFDYDSFVSGENLEQNILLAPGDRIVIPEQDPFSIWPF